MVNQNDSTLDHLDWVTYSLFFNANVVPGKLVLTTERRARSNQIMDCTYTLHRFTIFFFFTQREVVSNLVYTNTSRKVHFNFSHLHLDILVNIFIIFRDVLY